MGWKGTHSPRNVIELSELEVRLGGIYLHEDDENKILCTTLNYQLKEGLIKA